MSDTEPTTEDSEFAAKAREALEAKARLERDNALLRAGLDPDSDKAKLVGRLVEGEFTPESIKAAQETLAREFGAPGPQPTPEPSAPLEDPRRQAALEYHGATQGAGDRVEEPPPPDQVEQGWDNFRQARRRGTPVEDASAHVLGAFIGDVVEKGSASPYAWEGWDRHQEKQAR